MIEDTNSLLDIAKKSILFTSNRPDIIMEKGKGMYLWDTTGKEYLDFIGGWAVNCLGHSPEVIEKALTQQAKELVNASPTFYNKQMVLLVKLLTDNSCFDRVFFTNSGAEANESAIKLARKYGTKYLNGAFEIITAINSFHGRTIATMSATGKEHWNSLFEPKVPGFKHVPLNDIDAMLSAIGPNTCAIMLEPVQGESGVFSADKEYIKDLRKICDEKKIMLIFDEVQTGVGRIGKLFAYENYQVEPDVMTLAKGIGGGFPLSAMLTKEKYNIFDAGDQGGTYSSQPLAMAVGIAVMEEVIKSDLSSNAKVQGEYIIKRLFDLQSELRFKDIRGEGLLIAFDLSEPKGKEIVDECLKSGLIVNSPRPATIRLMPPLIVTKEDIDKMISILRSVLSKILR